MTNTHVDGSKELKAWIGNNPDVLRQFMVSLSDPDAYKNAPENRKEIEQRAVADMVETGKASDEVVSALARARGVLELKFLGTVTWFPNPGPDESILLARYELERLERAVASSSGVSWESQQVKPARNGEWLVPAHSAVELGGPGQVRSEQYKVSDFRSAGIVVFAASEHSKAIEYVERAVKAQDELVKQWAQGSAGGIPEGGTYGWPRGSERRDSLGFRPVTDQIARPEMQGHPGWRYLEELTRAIGRHLSSSGPELPFAAECCYALNHVKDGIGPHGVHEIDLLLETAGAVMDERAARDIEAGRASGQTVGEHSVEKVKLISAYFEDHSYEARRSVLGALTRIRDNQKSEPSLAGHGRGSRDAGGFEL